MGRNYAKLTGSLALALAHLACTPKPVIKVAPGEDHDLFPKSALLGRPLAAVAREPRLMPGLLQPVATLPDALQPLITGLTADAVAFDIQEAVLTVVAAKNGEALQPLARFKITGHYDLAPRAGGAAPVVLVRDQSEHPRWQERGYIEVDLPFMASTSE